MPRPDDYLPYLAIGAVIFAALALRAIGALAGWLERRDEERARAWNETTPAEQAGLAVVEQEAAATWLVQVPVVDDEPPPPPAPAPCGLEWIDHASRQIEGHPHVCALIGGHRIHSCGRGDAELDEDLAPAFLTPHLRPNPNDTYAIRKGLQPAPAGSLARDRDAGGTIGLSPFAPPVHKLCLRARANGEQVCDECVTQLVGPAAALPKREPTS